MLKDNLIKVKERVECACSKVKRDPSDIEIIAVSKGRPFSDIREVFSSGISDIGENRVQEASLKYSISDLPVRWHMLGHLQGNKVKEAVKIFDLIHSVDSLKLAREIDRKAAEISKVQDILIEVKTSYEQNKFGFQPEELVVAINDISGLRNLRVSGFMTVAPILQYSEDTRVYFRKLHLLREELKEVFSYNLKLSMGMSDDFEIAIEEGADIIRIGRAIFEGEDA